MYMYMNDMLCFETSVHIIYIYTSTCIYVHVCMYCGICYNKVQSRHVANLWICIMHVLNIICTYNYVYSSHFLKWSILSMVKHFRGKTVCGQGEESPPICPKMNNTVACHNYIYWPLRAVVILWFCQVSCISRIWLNNSSRGLVSNTCTVIIWERESEYLASTVVKVIRSHTRILFTQLDVHV